MSGSLTVEGLKEAIQFYDRENVRKALRRTIAELAAKSRTLADKMIREDYNIKKKDLKGKLKLTGVQKTEEGAELYLVVKGNKIPLIQFQAKQTAVGVSVRITKGGPAKIIPHTFKATMAYGEQVFERTVQGGKRSKRFPVKAQYGPAVTDLFRSRKIENAINKLVENETGTIFMRNLEFYLSKAGWNVEDILTKEWE